MDLETTKNPRGAHIAEFIKEQEKMYGPKKAAMEILAGQCVHLCLMSVVSKVAHLMTSGVKRDVQKILLLLIMVLLVLHNAGNGADHYQENCADGSRTEETCDGNGKKLRLLVQG